MERPAHDRSPHLAKLPARKILKRITCPHCWNRFAPEQLLWVSRHAELMGDQVLGSEAPSRFLPTRFNIDGMAVDSRGSTCHSFACPKCHLLITRDLLEMEPFFLSAIGVPSSGKSCFLASMTWMLRRVLPETFNVTFNDSDTLSNRSLNEYEETLFLQREAQGLVSIRKTQLQGDLYDQIKLGEQVINLPRPFLFTLRPSARHPNRARSGELSRVICLYDNAGEHFQPGMDTVASPVTQHLAKARVLMFMFDPTQDIRFREQCRLVSQDPQLSTTRRAQRQDLILTEAAERVRSYATVSTRKIDRPLMVLVGKSDVWGPLLPEVDMISEPLGDAGGGPIGVDLVRIESTSRKIRELMKKLVPELVALAEDLSDYVLFVPISALGRAPQEDPESKMLGYKPDTIEPRWVTVPMLYTFAKWSRGLIPVVVRK